MSAKMMQATGDLAMLEDQMYLNASQQKQTVFSSVFRIIFVNFLQVVDCKLSN